MPHEFRFLLLSFSYTLTTCSFAAETNRNILPHLEQVFSHLTANGPHINSRKCTFAVPKFNFLGCGCVVTSSDLFPIPYHVQPIHSFPPPAFVKSLQKFLGMLKFYHLFLPGIARILKPFSDAIAGTGNLSWTSDMHSSFFSTNSALASAVTLHHHIPSAILTSH
jgi:hypothetical protein